MQLPTWHHLNRHLNPSSQLYRPHLLVSHSFHLGKEYHYSPLFSGQKSWSHKSSFSLISTSCPAASRPEYLESLSLLTPSKPPSCPPHSCTSLLFLFPLLPPRINSPTKKQCLSLKNADQMLSLLHLTHLLFPPHPQNKSSHSLDLYWPTGTACCSSWPPLPPAPSPNTHPLR